MFLHVRRVRHLERYQLRVEFDDGVTKDIDLEGELYGAMFEPLREPLMFSKVRLNPETGTIEWPNGADLAPEFLYEKGTLAGQAA
jgi:hypothetical protein